MCTPVTPTVPYLLLGLQGVQWAVGNSRGACKLARTPHVNQKKKKRIIESNTSKYMSNMKCASLFSNFLFDDNEHFKLVYRLIKIKFCKLV